MSASSSFVDMDFKAPMAELKAIFEGFGLAKALVCGKIVVESDCIQVIIRVLNHNEVWGELEALLEDIWTILPYFYEVYFS